MAYPLLCLKIHWLGFSSLSSGWINNYGKLARSRRHKGVYMKKMKTITAFLVVLACLAWVSSAQAVPVWGTSVTTGNYTGSRSVGSGGGLTGNGAYASSFNVSWSISKTGSTYHYLYTLGGLNKDLSHTIIQVSDNFTANNIWNATQGSASGDPTTYSPSDPGNSNVGLPAAIHGIKFNGATGSTYVVSFDSDRAPVWGDIYGKSGNSNGQWTYVYNNGLPNSGSTDINDFIATPDSRGGSSKEPVVPEPATLSLIGLGLGGIVPLMRRRRSA